MILNSGGTKKEAKSVLKGRWLKIALIVFCYFLVNKGLDIVNSLFSKIGSNYYVGLFSLVVSVPFSFALTVYFVKYKRSENISVSGFFKDTFSDNFVRAWCVEGRIILKMIVPIILLVICFALCIPFLFKVILSGILMFVGEASNTFDSLSVLEQFDFSSHFGLFVIGSILFFICMIYAYIRKLRYVYSFNIAYDNPELSAKECVEQSDMLMKGNRFKYFILSLSFIGWKLVYLMSISAITFFAFSYILNINNNINSYSRAFGKTVPSIIYYACYIPIWLGSIFLTTYIRMSKTCFYENLKDNIK